MNPLYLRLDKVAEAILKAPELASDLSRLASLACTSEYHLHRAFNAKFGINIGAYARQLRLHESAFKLAFRPQKRILDIAIEAGFGSHESYAKAFKKHYNQSPSSFRKTPKVEALHQSPQITSLVISKEKGSSVLMNTSHDNVNSTPESGTSENHQLDVSVIQFPAVDIALMMHVGPPSQVMSTVSEFITWRRENKLPPSTSRTFNVLYDDPDNTPPESYRFGVACQILMPSSTLIVTPSSTPVKTSDAIETCPSTDTNHSSVTTTTIPEGYCAKVRHIGTDAELGAVVHALYHQWLPDTQFELRDFPIFLERIRFFPDVAAHEAITDVFLPIEAAK
ncbi:AraC family transcriptional regulator [Alteromonas stellipolaris]|uniref:AraC family transcriptional regulator n=1 Tax=Alteromonas stellipolaris TaxID=233316 RepID=UPI0026E28DAA|nr:AraC family transcriptional regulator [Alteromonas stellipolaris]MDO6533518.1 AraC family transcriptional regulator [Alteromonas stellipolaris]MDO6625488.1 AraC family transcriptional regulator [Alteromonas stellipolaris]